MRTEHGIFPPKCYLRQNEHNAQLLVTGECIHLIEDEHDRNGEKKHARKKETGKPANVSIIWLRSQSIWIKCESMILVEYPNIQLIKLVNWRRPIWHFVMERSNLSDCYLISQVFLVLRSKVHFAEKSKKLIWQENKIVFGFWITLWFSFVFGETKMNFCWTIVVKWVVVFWWYVRGRIFGISNGIWHFFCFVFFFTQNEIERKFRETCIIISAFPF